MRVLCLFLLISNLAFAKNQKVLMKTSMGDITIELFSKKSPISVKNFLKYVEGKKYDGTIFHRVISNFMIQGGGLDPNMKKRDTSAPIKNEAKNGLKNDKWTIAFARTTAPDSATNQFFINVKNNDNLNYNAAQKQMNGYAVFGKVTKGFKVVDSIKQVKTITSAGRRDVPQKTVIIKLIRKI